VIKCLYHKVGENLGKSETGEEEKETKVVIGSI
jgi:hypothetical protein